MGIIGTKPNQVPTNGDLGDLAYKDEKNLNPDVLAKILKDKFLHPGNINTVNAATATKLQTPRTITIGNTSKSFDGSADVSWSLEEIGVAALGLGGAAAPVPGGNIDDNTIPTGFYYVVTETSGTKPTGDDGYGHLIVLREGGGTTARQLYLDNTSNRIWTRTWGPSQWSGWVEIYHSGNIGDVSAATAAKLQTARTITIGNTSKSFDGSADVSWSLAEIGAGVSSINGLVGDLTGFVTETGAQSLTNKTLIDPKLILGGTNGTAGQVLTSQGTGLPPVWVRNLDSFEFSGSIYDNGSVSGNIVVVSALDIDCSLGNYFTKTISANSAFTFSNAPASRAYAFTLELKHISGTVTWPTSVRWPGDTAPTLTTGKTHLFTFVTNDGGKRWCGVANTNYTN